MQLDIAYTYILALVSCECCWRISNPPFVFLRWDGPWLFATFILTTTSIYIPFAGFVRHLYKEPCVWYVFFHPQLPWPARCTTMLYLRSLVVDFRAWEPIFRRPWRSVFFVKGIPVCLGHMVWMYGIVVLVRFLKTSFMTSWYSFQGKIQAVQ